SRKYLRTAALGANECHVLSMKASVSDRPSGRTHGDLPRGAAVIEVDCRLDGLSDSAKLEITQHADDLDVASVENDRPADHLVGRESKSDRGRLVDEDVVPFIGGARLCRECVLTTMVRKDSPRDGRYVVQA